MIRILCFLILALSLSGELFSQEKNRYSTIEVEALFRSRAKKFGWETHPTRLVSGLHGYVPVKNYKCTKYGSDPSVRTKATGFFRVQKTGGRWWMIDPEGYRHINAAVVHVGPGRGETNKAAFAEKFGSAERWIDSAARLLFANGFVGCGAWSTEKEIEQYNAKASRTLTRTPILNMMSGYGRTKHGGQNVPKSKMYPNKCIFVFDPEFETYCDEQAKKIAKWKDDPSIVGYFSDNELPLGLHCLEGYLDMEDPHDPGRKFAEKWLKQQKKSREQITDSLREEFAGEVIGRYYAIVSRALRKYDPNHMYLGSRLYSTHKFMEPVIKAAGKYLDVISINYYGDWSPREVAMRKWEEWTGKPFIITEFYTKGDDSGLPNSSGAGARVHTQRDRGYFYQNFCISLLESKNCVGWHWFRYQDNDPTTRGADPSNIDANKGIVDNSYEPYRDMLSLMREMNVNMYSIADYLDQ